ncbi:oxygen-insensitive NADPH nitroreductase [Alkalibacillus salilacus]|uniref:FMN reductase (NADPH) n=1 Tax=Alkalibacillus salilacus TaxID=284582 RepID=A0ABT9VGG5_9BACI|nr:oxygen-insensitive NADPH nitroreductase [Alkalibacillus salilacus]MDQ0160049.1 FMN reductase (NADPH) [Alkalibacillus salilacus]
MNETINLLMNHRSIRKFKDEKLTESQIKTIVEAGQAASTSSYYQAYSIIGVTDLNIKQQLREVSGQPYVEENGHLFVFCADLNRLAQSQDETTREQMKTNLESTEFFMMATIDATLAAQNCAVATESLGLGMCYLGSLRNDVNRVNDILNLPEYVVPLFGMAVGVPEEKPERKPRFDWTTVYHENQYDITTAAEFHAFDKTVTDYYTHRATNGRDDQWSEQIKRKLTNPMRQDVGPFIQDKSLNRH